MIKLDDIDKLIIQQKINFPHKKDSEICEAVNITLKEFKTRTGTHDFRYAFSEASKPFESQLDDLKGNALRKLKQLINDPDKKIAIEAIKAVLGANHQKTEKFENKKTPFEKRLSREMGLD